MKFLGKREYELKLIRGARASGLSSSRMRDPYSGGLDRLRGVHRLVDANPPLLDRLPYGDVHTLVLLDQL
jgi:hypothetical protein